MIVSKCPHNAGHYLDGVGGALSLSPGHPSQTAHRTCTKHKEVSCPASRVDSQLLMTSGSSALTAWCHSVIISSLSVASGGVFTCSWGYSATSPPPPMLLCVRKKTSIFLIILHPSTGMLETSPFTLLHPTDVSLR